MISGAPAQLGLFFLLCWATTEPGRTLFETFRTWPGPFRFHSPCRGPTNIMFWETQETRSPHGPTHTNAFADPGIGQPGLRSGQTTAPVPKVTHACVCAFWYWVSFHLCPVPWSSCLWPTKSYPRGGKTTHPPSQFILFRPTA